MFLRFPPLLSASSAEQLVPHLSKATTDNLEKYYREAYPLRAIGQSAQKLNIYLVYCCVARRLWCMCRNEPLMVESILNSSLYHSAWCRRCTRSGGACERQNTKRTPPASGKISSSRDPSTGKKIERERNITRLMSYVVELRFFLILLGQRACPSARLIITLGRHPQKVRRRRGLLAAQSLTSLKRAHWSIHVLTKDHSCYRRASFPDYCFLFLSRKQFFFPLSGNLTESKKYGTLTVVFVFQEHKTGTPGKSTKQTGKPGKSIKQTGKTIKQTGKSGKSGILGQKFLP